MKKLLSLVVAGGLLAASASMATAADIKVKGQLNFGFGLYDGSSFVKHDGDENFDANQRLRTQVDIIASESLKGVARFEIGETEWGGGSGATWGGPAAGRGMGGAMGADGVAVEVKWLYLDWLVPETDLQVRMGIQPFATPRAVGRADMLDGAAIIDDDVAGLLLSYNFNENVGANLGWFRPWDGSVSGDGSNVRPIENDEIDMFFLSLPIEVKDTFSFTPWGMYALIGDNPGADMWQSANSSYGGTPTGWLTGNGTFGNDGKAWWAGFAFDLSYFDPFVAAIDFNYGSYTADNSIGKNGLGTDPDRDGWTVVAKFGYKLDYFTPILFGWYGSGADIDDVDNPTLDGLLPVLSPFWGLTSYGWAGVNVGDREAIIGATPAGTWAIGAGLEDIRFIDNLTSHFRVAYFRGTSDAEEFNKANPDNVAFFEYGVLDKSDWGVEVNLNNVINVYENLDMFVDLAYIHLDVAEAGDNFEENAWKGFVGFQYNF
ncbi:MAG: outer membrane homotrimeric porin [Desulfovibrionaceae bacterium]|nr:outer membrane homotrimeric porin [Desulfovibrionaceae bacterium]